MSEDLTKKLPKSDSEKISLILTTVQHLETRVDKLERRFDGLEKKVDERLYDTRPIWEKVVADIGQLQAGQMQLQEGQQRLEGDVREIKESVRDIDRRVSFLSDTMIRVQANYRDIDNRVYEFELQQRKQSKPQT